MNTCSVRERRRKKVFSLLGEWRLLKARRPQVIIGVGGCVASQEGSGITERRAVRGPGVGPQTLHRLPQMLDELRRTGKPVVDVSFRRSRSSIACRHRVPRARGPSCPSWRAAASTAASARAYTPRRGSEPLFDSVLEEVGQLAAQGVAEVTLLGQNVKTAYSTDGRRRAVDPRHAHPPCGARAGDRTHPASPLRTRSSSTTA